MSLTITKVINSNKPLEECVYLEVIEDNIDIHKYAIVDQTFTSKDFKSNKDRHFFRFPRLAEKYSKKGVIIQLYTGKGNPSWFENENKLVLYWGLDTCIWNNNGNDEAELLRVSTQMKKKVSV